MEICNRNYRFPLGPGSGWTLVELLSSMTIVAILTGAGLPAMNRWLQQQAQATTFHDLHHLIYYARSAAIKRQRFITVCPSRDHHRCSSDWNSTDIMVFTDFNKNRIVETETDLVLRVSALPRQASCLQLRASAQKQYLQFKPSGASNGIAGHFRFCEDATTSNANKMVISLNGRSRIKKL